MKIAILLFSTLLSIGLIPAPESHAGENNLFNNNGNDASLSVFLDSLFNEAKEEGFSGTFLVADRGNVVYENAAGYADKDHSLLNNVDTKFNTASLSKMFTGVAIVQLEQQGKLSYEDKVGKYLPDYPNKRIRDNVTIHQLLTHTSGIGSWWDEFFETKKWNEIKTTSDFDNLINHKELLFEPGEKFHYSNGGPIILGLIIEKLTGETFEQYINKNIFEPAGMNNSGYFDIENPVENMALGYTRMDPRNKQMLDEFKSNSDIQPTKGSPAGGAYTTVKDLLKFDKALRGYTLVDKKHFRILTDGKVDSDIRGVKYAYLFQNIPLKKETITGHSGGSAGVSAAMDIYLNSGYTVIILSNIDKGTSRLLGKVFNKLTKMN